jgi:hypothetical protein
LVCSSISLEVHAALHVSAQSAVGESEHQINGVRLSRCLCAEIGFLALMNKAFLRSSTIARGTGRLELKRELREPEVL